MRAAAPAKYCGSIDRFARAHLYMMSPGLVARCAVCEHVLLRLVSAGQRVLLDARGLTYLSADTSKFQEPGR